VFGRQVVQRLDGERLQHADGLKALRILAIERGT
jgi:hypothetical protein